MLRYILKESIIDSVNINLHTPREGLFDVSVRIERKEDIEKMKASLEKTPLKIIDEPYGMEGKDGKVIIPFGITVRVQAENSSAAEKTLMKWLQGKGFVVTDRDLGLNNYEVFTKVRDKEEAIAFAEEVGGAYGFLDPEDYKIIKWESDSDIPKNARFAVSKYVDVDRFGHGVKTQKDADELMLKKLEDWRKKYRRGEWEF